MPGCLLSVDKGSPGLRRRTEMLGCTWAGGWGEGAQVEGQLGEDEEEGRGAEPW